MKTKFTYALLVLLCCTLGASSNRNSGNCDALKEYNSQAVLTEGNEQTEKGTEALALPEATGYLPGLNIVFAN